MSARLVALDIGGTKLMAAAADPETGELLKRVRHPTPKPLQEGLDLLDAMVSDVLEGAACAGIGAAAGGPLDWRTGVVSPLHQPAWREVPLKARMENRWGCRFSVDVDTNVAALGEYRFGGYTESRLLYVTLSTGMGGGFIVDGSIYRGGLGGAHPEIGHQAVPFRCAHPERVRCDCGATGCLEGLVSGTAIRRIYGKPAEQLEDAEWAEVSWNLGMGLRNIAALLAPDVIVIGGGLSLQGDRLLGPARTVMAEGLRLVPPPRVAASRLGYDTALIGCIALVLSSS